MLVLSVIKMMGKEGYCDNYDDCLGGLSDCLGSLVFKVVLKM